MHKQKKIDAGRSTEEEPVVKGKAVKFYKLADDPEKCHETKVDHVLAKLKEGI